MKKIILIILLLVLVFYHIFPQALPLFGFTFIVASGAIGLILYSAHRYPYGEVISIALPFFLLFGWTLFCMLINGGGDSYIMDISKSQVAWLFSAYFVIQIFFLVHPKGGLDKLLYYIIAAIVLQCVIAVAMFQDESIANFFNSIQKLDAVALAKRAETEGRRLLGYGTAFFGAGIVCGIAMIFLIYIIMTKKLNMFQLLLAAFLYSGIFYVGLLMARTTMVGGAASLILAIILMFTRNTHKNQFFTYLLFSIILISLGYSLCYVYFPEFADWAFEAFINYQETGEFRTKSSDGITAGMFAVPSDIFTWLFGTGRGHFMGVDVGYTRLLFWFGLPGTIIFFYFLYVSMKFAFTKNKAFNLTLITLFAYNMALNIKGYSELNYICFLITFYFLYYKYYIYTPYLYRIGKLKKTELRDAIQTPATGGGL